MKKRSTGKFEEQYHYTKYFPSKKKIVIRDS